MGTRAGASEGIGAAFARALAGAGFGVLVARRRGAARGAGGRAAQLRARGRDRPLDLAAPDLEARLQAICDERDVGVLVYNAALSTVAPFVDTPLADKERILAVNVRGPLVAAHVFGEAMAGAAAARSSCSRRSRHSLARPGSRPTGPRRRSTWRSAKRWRSSCARGASR